MLQVYRVWEKSQFSTHFLHDCMSILHVYYFVFRIAFISSNSSLTNNKRCCNNRVTKKGDNVLLFFLRLKENITRLGKAMTPIWETVAGVRAVATWRWPSYTCFIFIVSPELPIFLHPLKSLSADFKGGANKPCQEDMSFVSPGILIPSDSVVCDFAPPHVAAKGLLFVVYWPLEIGHWFSCQPTLPAASLDVGIGVLASWTVDDYVKRNCDLQSISLDFFSFTCTPCGVGGSSRSSLGPFSFA